MVDAYSPYTTIVARPWLHALGVVSSTLHQKVKYPSKGQVKEIVGNQSMARQCLVAAILHRPKSESSTFVERGLQQSKTLALPDDGSAKEAKCEDLERVVVGDNLEKFFQVEAQLPPQEREELIEFLRKNVEVFAWNAYETPGVDPNFICHHLNANPFVIPRKQPPRCLSKDHFDVVRDQVRKLKQAWAIKEVFYPEWLANTVVVKKKNRKWRVCVDFTNLNKACPKDPFPLPRID